jgi:hypothetical protein
MKYNVPPHNSRVCNLLQVDAITSNTKQKKTIQDNKVQYDVLSAPSIEEVGGKRNEQTASIFKGVKARSLNAS